MAQELVFVVLDVVDLRVSEVSQAPDFHELQDQRVRPDGPRVLVSCFVLPKLTERTDELRHVPRVRDHRAMLLLVSVKCQDFAQRLHGIELTLDELVLRVEFLLARFDETLEYSSVSRRLILS